MNIYITLNSLNGVIAYATKYYDKALEEAERYTLNSLNGVIAYATTYGWLRLVESIKSMPLNSLNGVIAYATRCRGSVDEVGAGEKGWLSIP